MKRTQRVGHAFAARASAGEPGGLAQPRSREALKREVLRLSARVEKLEREREQLEHITAIAAHELLEPLVMTEAYATMVSERAGYALDLNSRHELDAIRRVAARVRRLVEGLLAEARASGRPLEPTTVDLSELIKDCVDMLATEIAARSARLHIDSMPVIQGDYAMLSSVFGNLLTNALKYGPRSRGDIWVTAARSSNGWTFAVESAGPVIPEESRERIFNVWERGSVERRTRGSGLGLTIVRQIVERHGGQVGVTSPSDSTNRFFFTLPA